MPRKTHGTHPDHVRTAASQPAPAAQTDEREAHHSPAAPVGQFPPGDRLWFDLRDILDREDGWLRIVPDHDQKVLWVKWKYTRGRWRGHYIMVRMGIYEHGLAASMLLRKLNDVDLGQARPTLDSYYDQG